MLLTATMHKPALYNTELLDPICHQHSEGEILNVPQAVSINPFKTSSIGGINHNNSLIKQQQKTTQ
jgi:hypothetical protein